MHLNQQPRNIWTKVFDEDYQKIINVVETKSFLTNFQSEQSSAQYSTK